MMMVMIERCYERGPSTENIAPVQGTAVVPAFKHAAGTKTSNPLISAQEALSAAQRQWATLHHLVSIVQLLSSVLAPIQQ